GKAGGLLLVVILLRVVRAAPLGADLAFHLHPSSSGSAGVGRRETERVQSGGEHLVRMAGEILTTNNGSDKMLLEGDIVLPKNRNAMKCWYNSCLWSKASNGYVVVPYVIGREFTSYERQTIKTSMRAFASSTCVHFQQRTNNGIAMHELNHALGFQHEQNRSDRDSYIRINWQNIIPDTAYNFNKHDTSNLNTPYDFFSMMHYGRDAFAIAYGLDTITPISNARVQVGQRRGLSNWDVSRINICQTRCYYL
uniref:Peptidase M12A domain-containing protein n=1 Tax=Poecilia reticulata TaxID=8081 RepID=A0A3P9N8P8_POERE